MNPAIVAAVTMVEQALAHPEPDALERQAEDAARTYGVALLIGARRECLRVLGARPGDRRVNLGLGVVLRALQIEAALSASDSGSTT